MSDNTPINAGVGGDTIATDDIGGVKYQRVKVIIGADGVNSGDVSAANPIPAIIAAASPATTVIGTVQPPAITKGTPSTFGFSTQDLKDSGRVIVSAVTAIAGVACVNAEAMLALDLARDGAVSGSVTTIPVTAAKKFRITGLMVGMINTGAAVMSGRVSLRLNPGGAAVVASPILCTVPLSSGPAVAQQGNQIFVPFPDGIEIFGLGQVGLSQVFSVAGGTVWASLIGFEY